MRVSPDGEGHGISHSVFRRKMFRTAAVAGLVLAAAGLFAFRARAGRFLLYLDARLSQGSRGQARGKGGMKILSNPRIVIRKSQRRLLLYDGDDLVATYAAGLGFAPAGHKKSEGDGKTPEGSYYICAKNPESRFHLSLGLSYPNAEDAAAALAAGRITRAEHDAIADAIAKGHAPGWKSALGGEIFIHGHGSKHDWTAGCIALDDPAVEELYESVSLGTPVEILP